MSTEIAIVPIALTPFLTKTIFDLFFPTDTARRSCVIRAVVAEASFFTGVDEHIIQGVIKGGFEKEERF